MNKNPFAPWAALTLIAASLMGCGKPAGSSDSASSSATPESAAATTPVMESVLTVWQQGDKPVAVTRFVAADWGAGPVFAPGSTLSLSEDQFKSLSASDREAKSADMLAQTGALKQLAAAVAQAGRDAAAKKDFDQARNHFTSLKQCGESLDRPDSLALLKLVGQSMKKLAAAELAKLTP